jgi:transketolase
MTGIAAGMALTGKIVFTYSIANFPILRCLEQVRNDVCYHNANVKIVAVGGGLAYGALGASHHATEDLAIMRALPNMTVVAPGDPAEAEAATLAVASLEGPCYLRLGRAGEPRVHCHPFKFEVGKAITLREGRDLTLISTGGLLQTTVQVADLLAVAGLNARVLSMHTVQPLDAETIKHAARDTRAVFTLEEHSKFGGLGGAVAEVLAEADLPALIFKRFALPATFSCVVGSQEYIRATNGLTSDSLSRAIQVLLEKNEAKVAVRAV